MCRNGPVGGHRMKRRLLAKHLLCFLFGAGVLLALLMSSISMVALNKSFYHAFYEDYGLAEKAHIRQEDAISAIDLMVDYVSGTREDLNGTIVWKNGEQPTFNEKEISHMVDVKRLWINARNVGIAGAVLALAAALILKQWSPAHWLSWLCKGMIMAASCLVVLLVFFGFWMSIDFTGLWIQFHHWFFTNDLWALDPYTDFMIVICPESLFFTMILKISLYFGIPVLFLIGFSIYYLKKKAVIGFESCSDSR